MESAVIKNPKTVSELPYHSTSRYSRWIGMKIRSLALLASLGAILPSGFAQTKFFASAVSYCSDARAIDVSNFQLEYDFEQALITFNLTAASVSKNLFPTLDISLNAYGIEAVNFTQNVCDLFDSNLCPLPMYEFNGAASIPIPGDIASSVQVPSIAFVIPDLQALATIRLIDNETGEEAACLSVQLSNGLTTKQPGAAWALGGTALLSLLVGVLGGLLVLWKGKGGQRAERFLQIFAYYQFCSTVGLLALNYPLVLIAFTTNFVWSLGLFNIPSVQRGIYRLRELTGGSFAPDYLVGGTESLGFRVDRMIEGETPTLRDAQSYGALEYGIPRMATEIGLAVDNVYMTVFITSLFLLCVFLAVALLLAIPFVLHKRGRKEGGHFLKSMATRMLIIVWFPLTLFTFFQWTRRDAWLPSFIAALTFLGTTSAILFLSLANLPLASKFRRAPKFDETEHGIRERTPSDVIPLRNPFRETREWFYLPLLGSVFVRAAFIAFAKNSGWAQTVVLLLIEIVILVAMAVFTPFHQRASNATNITLQILRVIVSGVLIAFNSTIVVNGITRVILGFVIVVIEGLGVILLFFLVFTDLIQLIIVAIRKPPQSPQTDDEKRLQRSELEGDSSSDQRSGSIETAERERRRKEVV